MLRAAAAEFHAHLEAVPGLYELSDSLSLGKRHFEVHLTPAGVAAGLTLAGIGAQLRANYHGVEVQRIQRGHEEIKVMLKYPEDRRRSLSELSMERVHRPGGGEVPLSTVAGIPIALAGAIYSHWILGWDLTGMSIFGVIAVAGVVVNDTLVLLDRYNTLRRDDANIPAIAAAAAATRHRFRAVFLTSLTTVLGLSPLLYERSEELLLMVPFVVSMLGGLVFSSVFVLFFLPTLVMLVDGRRE